MQVRVKTPRTRIDITGDVSKDLIRVLKKDYGSSVIIEDDEWVPAKETEWYKKTSSRMKPGDHLRAYRTSRGWAQSLLGKKLGGLSRQNISDMEHGRRTIGKKVAKKLSALFGASVEKFL